MDKIEKRDSEILRKEVESNEPSIREPVQENGLGQDRRALQSGASSDKGSRHEIPRKRGRPANRWRIRVVRIDSQKYPNLERDREHPFLALSAQARTQEIDSFLARLWGRTRKWGNQGPGRLRSAA